MKLRSTNRSCPDGCRRYGHITVILAALVTLTVQGCSVKGMAMNGLADALSGGGSSVYLTDDDPVLVGEALPFSLKLMETVLQDTPDHEGLLVAVASGFVMYGQAWVLRPARSLEADDLGASRQARQRAKALFLRARGYAGRALEARHPGFLAELADDPEWAVRKLRPRDLPAMYWYAAATGSVLTSDLSDMMMVAEFSVVPALLRRGLVLNESWNQGALHELMMVMPASAGGTAEKAERHFERAMELNGGGSLGPLVSLAEVVCVPQQDRGRFTRLLTEVLAFDLESHPENRLANTMSQEHAAWLLSRTEQLFLTNPNTAQHRPPERKEPVRWPARF